MEQIEFMIGKTPVSVDIKDDEEIIFKFSDGSSTKFYHIQDCCESVWIEDINGSFDNIIGHPLVVAEERNEYEIHDRYDSMTWTFYTFRSIGGSVDVRWCGSSNGYYSESVDIQHMEA